MRANPGRWSTYFLRRGGDFHEFWREYLSSTNRNILFVLGLGFDPRMCLGYEAVLQAGGKGRRDCKVVELDEGPSSPSLRHSDLTRANGERLEQLVPDGSVKTDTQVAMWSKDGRRVGSRVAANLFSDTKDFAGYTDLVIDVSAMPRSVYFPLIGKLLYLEDSSYGRDIASRPPNLHVLVSENAQLDANITDEGIDDDASYVHGFTGNLETEGAAGAPKVWIPILGEKKGPQLERIYNKVLPEEICPLVPMPSGNPRRVDELLIEYRELLFDRLRVEPRNFIYAAEKNPFEVYREVYRTVRRYDRSLKSLGPCQVAISALSSKLLSIGALLAAYELKEQDVGVAHVESQGYYMERQLDTEELKNTELTTLWIAGDCYNE